MKPVLSPFASVLLGISLTTSFLTAFEPLYHGNVPCSDEVIESIESGSSDFPTILSRIAVSDGLSDAQSSEILAAARRIAPLDRTAFLTEYQLTIGHRPTEVKGYPRDEDLKAIVAPYLENLRSVSGSAPFIEFLTDALAREVELDGKASKIPVDPFAPTEAEMGSDVFEQSCHFLTSGGCTPLTARGDASSNGHFQYLPGNLNSELFRSAYRESLKHLAIRHVADLEGLLISFQTDSRVEEEDGPAAALASAVLTRAIAEKTELDESISYFGDVNADGTVQPVDGMVKRLMENPGTLCQIVVIPEADLFQAEDLLLLNGPDTFIKTQLIAVEDLDAAMSFGGKIRSDSTDQAIKLFDEIQRVLQRPGGEKLITNSHVRMRLKKVVKLMPEHVSARQLLLLSLNRPPRQLSLSASIDLIFEALDPVIEKGEIDMYGHLDPDSYATLNRFNNRLDPSLAELTMAVIQFETSGRLGSNSRAERARLSQRLKEQINAMSRNVRVREKMMK